MVKEKQAATDGMFDPLKDVIDLLRNYGVEIPQVSFFLRPMFLVHFYAFLGRRAWCS